MREMRVYTKAIFSDYQQQQVRNYSLARGLSTFAESRKRPEAVKFSFLELEKGLSVLEIIGNIGSCIRDREEDIEFVKGIFLELSLYSRRSAIFLMIQLLLAAIVFGVFYWMSFGIFISSGASIAFMIVANLAFQMFYWKRIITQWSITPFEADFALNHIVGNPKWQKDLSQLLKQK